MFTRHIAAYVLIRRVAEIIAMRAFCQGFSQKFFPSGKNFFVPLSLFLMQVYTIEVRNQVILSLTGIFPPIKCG